MLCVYYEGKPGSASSGSASTGTGASHCTEKPAKPTGQSMEKPAKPASQASSSQKKSKLIISGSLFSKKDKAAPKEQSPKEQPGGALPKKTKEGGKVSLSVGSLASFYTHKGSLLSKHVQDLFVNTAKVKKNAIYLDKI